MSWLNQVFTSGYTIQRYPLVISPDRPDFFNCDPRYGRELVKGDCKAAVMTMPWARRNAEVDWAVNFHAQEYNLPMSFNAVPEGSPEGSVSDCVITVEVAGPAAFYDITRNRAPFTIKASPFQLRGLAAYVIKKCVSERGYIGGFATNKVQNLVDYIRVPGWNPDAPYPPSSSYLTVAVTNKRPKEPSPGDFDPSIAVLIAENLASEMKGANNADRARLSSAVNDFTLRTQKMYKGGKTTPWWGAVAASADDMTYECDGNLGAPAPVDCAQVEWSELGADEDTFSLAAGAIKFLSSSTCQVAITAAVAITVNWRQVRVALDTLLNVCVAHPLFPATGGRAHYGPQPIVSRRSSIQGRQYNNGTGEDCGIDECGLLEDPIISGLNALPQGLNITVYNDPSPFVDDTTEAGSCAYQAVLAGKPTSSCGKRPPERMLGANSTGLVNSTIALNATIL